MFYNNNFPCSMTIRPFYFRKNHLGCKMLYLYLNLFLSVFVLARKIQCKRYIYVYKQNKKYCNKIIVKNCADIEHFLNSNYCLINT